jgi:hypothetical protein
LAFVQIALGVKNPGDSLLSWALAMMYAMGEVFLMPIRKDYIFNFSFGHHCIMSTEAIRDVSGFPEDVGVGEDIDIAIGIQTLRNSHGNRKWIGKHIHYLRLNEIVPHTFEALKTQLWRWSFGTSRVFIKRLKEILQFPLPWNEKRFLLNDLMIFFKTCLIAFATILIPPVLTFSQLFHEVAYPKELSMILMLTWMIFYGTLFAVSLNYIKRNDQQAAVNAIGGCLIAMTASFAITPTLFRGTLYALRHTHAAFGVTSKEKKEIDESVRDIFNKNW